jgi:hypothetical protein
MDNIILYLLRYIYPMYSLTNVCTFITSGAMLFLTNLVILPRKACTYISSYVFYFDLYHVLCICDQWINLIMSYIHRYICVIVRDISCIRIYIHECISNHELYMKRPRRDMHSVTISCFHIGGPFVSHWPSMIFDCSLWPSKDRLPLKVKPLSVLCGNTYIVTIGFIKVYRFTRNRNFVLFDNLRHRQERSYLCQKKPYDFVRHKMHFSCK